MGLEGKLSLITNNSNNCTEACVSGAHPLQDLEAVCRQLQVLVWINIDSETEKDKEIVNNHHNAVFLCG